MLGIDADPVNQTLSEYRGLAVSCLNLLKEGSVDQREFDLLMERFLTESGTFVVDTGASSFYSSLALYLRKPCARLFAGERQTGVRSFGYYWRPVAERHASWIRATGRNTRRRISLSG